MKPPSPDELEQLIRHAMVLGDWATADRYGLQLDEQLRAQHRTPTLAGSALWYAAAGLKVFPVKPGDKRPYPGTHGVKEASTDPGQIRAWWAEHARANVAIATGHLVDVIDVDGPTGVKTWAGLAGLDGLGEVIGIVNTPRPGGSHLYRTATGLGNMAGFQPGLDYRGKGGYVVAPPSVNAAGISYTWRRPLDVGALKGT